MADVENDLLVVDEDYAPIGALGERGARSSTTTISGTTGNTTCWSRRCTNLPVRRTLEDAHL